MPHVAKWFGWGAMLFVTCPEIAAAQTANAFDGKYVGVSATNLGGMQRGSTSAGCRSFNAPSPLTIANGRVQGKWGDVRLTGR